MTAKKDDLTCEITLMWGSNDESWILQKGGDFYLKGSILKTARIICGRERLSRDYLEST